MKRSSLIKSVALVIIIAAVAFAVFKFGFSSKKPKLNSEAWYAVFLTNNQVYFGHLAGVTDQYVSLENIYYLQMAKPLQSTDAKDLVGEDQSKSQLTLIKLGKELHGPKDKMTINRDSVLFYEELGDDSKVVKTIKNSNK